MVPVIGLDNSDISGTTNDSLKTETYSGNYAGERSFINTQPDRLVKAIAKELDITDYSTIINWELELFDVQPAQVGGIDKEFIFAGRIDDKLCSWAAVQALLNSTATSSSTSNSSSGIVKVVGLFDDEEIGSQLRQGAKSDFLPSVLPASIALIPIAVLNIGPTVPPERPSFLI